MPIPAEIIAQKNESLRRAWTILQVIRAKLEASRGKPLPRPEKKSLDEEGRILCEAMGEELFDLHDKLNRAALAADQCWEFHMGRWMGTTVNRDVHAAKEYPRLRGNALHKLREK